MRATPAITYVHISYISHPYLRMKQGRILEIVIVYVTGTAASVDVGDQLDVPPFVGSHRLSRK